MTTTTPLFQSASEGSAMSSIQREAMNRAIRLLNAAGCQYAILTPDGEKLGALEIIEPKHRTRRMTGIDYRPLYLEKVKALQPGDCVRIVAPDDIRPNALRSTITAWCSQKYGKGACLTTINGQTIELLRVE